MGRGRYHQQKADSNRRAKISGGTGAQKAAATGKGPAGAFVALLGEGSRGGEAVEGGKGQFNRGLHGMLGILILSFWAFVGLLSNSEQGSDAISSGMLFW